MLHGPALAATKSEKKERKAPANWFYGARLNPDLAAAVDRAASADGVTIADVVRSALVLFLKISEQESDYLTVSDQPAGQTITAPRTAAPYRGDGGSDHAGLMGVNQRRSQRHANGQAGERLVDKSPVR